jgi:hypothetical protein
MRGKKPYQLWRDNRPAFELYQSVQGFDGKPKLASAKYWASFLAMPNGETLFAGLYAVASGEVLETQMVDPSTGTLLLPGTRNSYTLHLAASLTDLIGKLVIDWGSGTRAWVQYADRQNKVILELRRAFTEPSFPGFDQFIEPLSRIESLPSSWLEALRSTSGVYLLTCPRTKELYVGSASGIDGFLGRFMGYATNNHGGNIALIGRDPSDFQVSILETAGSSATVE